MTTNPHPPHGTSESDRDEAWIEAMVALEEERGPLVPNGAQGNPHRSKARPAAARARDRVRYAAQAVEPGSAA
jgi:hypothetical protein